MLINVKHIWELDGINMKRQVLILIFFITVFIRCTSNSDEIVVDCISTNQYPSKSWQFVQEIDFKSFKGTDTIPWTNINNPDTIRILDRYSKVLRSKLYLLHIDYPLKVTATYVLKSDNGFSRIDLIKIISAKYQQIYNEEGRQTITVGNQTVERVSNTPTKFGICCHDINELDLGSIQIYKDNNGIFNIILLVES